jgi:uncharacterized protein YcbX
LQAWFSDYFSDEVEILQNATNGFPDDSEASGPTIVSEASLQRICNWFPGISTGSVRSRFRANLELTGVAAFWEDRLFGEQGQVVRFRLGDVEIHGCNPCRRCVVPTRDPGTGEVYPEFMQQFMEKRAADLPSWTNDGQFDHYYRFAVNTLIPASQAGKLLRVGEQLQFL